MSKLKAVHFGILVDLGTTIAATHDIIKNRLTAQLWQVTAESNIDANRFLDVIPPADQPVGNTLGREGLRIIVSGTSITFLPTITSTVPRFKAFRLSGLQQASNAQTIGVNVGATKISGPGVGVSADANMAELHRLLSTSVDADVSQYNYQLITGTATASDDYILATAKNLNAPAFAAATGVTYGPAIQQIASDYAANNTVALPNGQVIIPIDLAAGFVYFMTVFERTIGFATKTTAGVYGPVFATFADNASAKSQTPMGCIPVELLVFDMKTFVPGSTMNINSGHNWGMSITPTEQAPIFDEANRTFSYGNGSIEDLKKGTSGASTLTYHTLRTLGASNITLSGWQIMTGLSTAILGITSSSSPASTSSGGSYAFTLLPNYALPDVFTFIGNASDESLQFTRDLENPTTLSAPVAIADVTVTLADATAFAAAGMVIIGTEVMEYTGKAGNQLTGVTRGKYGTTAQAHTIGKTAYPGLWFMKFNGGAMLAGYTRPA